MESLPRTKSELLRQLGQSWTELENALKPLTDKELTSQRDRAGWSIKDHLDHLAVWEEGVAALLERKPRLAAMGLDAADEKGMHDETMFDRLNAKIRERTKSRSLTETRAALRASREHLVRALDALNDADLFRSYSHYQPEESGEDRNKPVIGWIVGNSSGHYMEHLPWIRGIASTKDQ